MADLLNKAFNQFTKKEEPVQAPMGGTFDALNKLRSAGKIANAQQNTQPVQTSWKAGDIATRSEMLGHIIKTNKTDPAAATSLMRRSVK